MSARASTPAAGEHAAIADAVMSNIMGCRDAQRLIFAVRQGCAPADALLEGSDQVRATDDAVRQRGFYRELQKALESPRAAGPEIAD